MKISDYLANKYNISKRLAKKYIKEGFVFVDQKIIKKDFEISNNSKIILNVNQKTFTYNINNYLIRKYDNILFLYKPPFMHTERLRIEDDLTISDIVSKEFPEYILISRLDFETDGVIGAIKKDYIIEIMQKKYYAVVKGNFQKEVKLSKKIDYKKRKKVKVLDEDDENETIIRPLNFNNGFSLVEIILEKAKRHQIRAYLSYLGHPILGDKLYGGQQFERMMLSCIYTKINEFEAYSPKIKDFIDNYYNFIPKNT
ncbi:pseudouridine synthase family protein [Deferribacter abyssi]|uniref:pseudouridine synthase family protein n=1 Tax=Deferribacter abyssi TaxID=213806 RepID=UPI003C14FB69